MNVAVEPITYVVLLSVPIVAGLAGCGLYYYSTRAPQASDTADQLLLQLCKLHAIRYPHQVLLHAIADAAELDTPAILFAMPERFDDAVRKAIDANQLTDREQKSIGQLRRQMFA